jgi:two-component sensor histidine kinase
MTTSAETVAPSRPTSRLSGRELLLTFLFWTSLATLSAVNRLIDPRIGIRLMSPTGSIALTYIESWIWAAFTPLIFWLSSRVGLERSSRWFGRVLLLLGIGLIVSLVVYALIDFARFEIFEIAPPRRRGGPPLWIPFEGLGRYRFVNQFLVYLAILVAGFAREYFLRDQIKAREAVELQARAATLQAQLAEARMAALRMQLNPHFLFNTLHAVSALVERNPAGVRKMIARLSELLRRTIDSRADDEVPLRDELAFLQRYIEIMEIRFQDRLRVDQTIAAGTLEALVPNFVLQPLVENALEHGAARAMGEARIEIAARRDGSRLVMTVRDNGPGPGVTDGRGVGLANTRARLAELYGDAASLTLTSAAGGGALAEIVVPFRTLHGGLAPSHRNEPAEDAGVSDTSEGGGAA